MTLDRRRAYFSEGADLILNESGWCVQQAFLHDMQQVDVEGYDFQSNIPQNELHETLACVADEFSYISEFTDAWQEGKL